MTTALRRSSIVAAAVLLLVVIPAQAAGPLALLGKQLLKEAAKDFLMSELTSFAQQSLGPCKSMLAQAGPGATIQGMASTLGGGGASLPGIGPHMTNPLLGQIDPAVLARMDPAKREQMAKAMAELQAMRSAPPLSAGEVEELVDRLVMISKAIPDHELPCSPQELKLVFGMSASMPMGAGPLRMMLEQFRTLDDHWKKVHECFAQMSSAEEDEAIDLIAAEVASADPTERKKLAGFIQTDLAGLPLHVREKLRARLARLP